jgi:hypothetical protein
MRPATVVAASSAGTIRGANNPRADEQAQIVLRALRRATHTLSDGAQ